MQRQVGIIGLGNMGGRIADRLHDAGYALALYNRTAEKYDRFKGMEDVRVSAGLDDFSSKLERRDGPAVVWVMLPGGDATNKTVEALSRLLRKGDIVIDASNAVYTDSIANYRKLKGASIHYLDVGCAGGPGDLLEGVSLMVGGDKEAYERVKDVLTVVAGNGTYGYVGASGSGQITKLVHNGIFYGIFPVFAEGAELLAVLKRDVDGRFDVDEALRLLASSPPITRDIMNAIAEVVKQGLPQEAPEMKVSDVIKWEAEKATQVGVKFSITRAVLAEYGSMSEGSRRIYGAAKKLVTGH